jgi:hypothetical protein
MLAERCACQWVEALVDLLLNFPINETLWCPCYHVLGLVCGFILVF